MTLRETAVVTAKWWGILPHVIWHYPFRYFKELRDAYLDTLRSPRRAEDEPTDFHSTEVREKVIEYDQELFKGDSL